MKPLFLLSFLASRTLWLQPARRSGPEAWCQIPPLSGNVMLHLSRRWASVERLPGYWHFYRLL